MSRIRNTLDSVTKAVSSTDLLSKFSRLKPGSATVDSARAGKTLSKNETSASNNTATASLPETAMKGGEDEKTTEENEAEKQYQQATEKPFVSPKKSTSTTVSAASLSVPSPSSNVALQKMPLFHPAALSTNMDETYKTLAQHINSYFGTSAQAEEGPHLPVQQHRGQEDPGSEPVISAVCQTKPACPILSPVAETKSIDASTTSGPPPAKQQNLIPPVGTTTSDIPVVESAAQVVPASAASPKKGFTQYLSYPRPSVQAFVGSYIAPLVPKFRGDAKSTATEKSTASAVEEPTSEKAGEKTESKEEKIKQQLLTQREKVSYSVWF